jgi:hypothetical protein
VSEFCRAAAFIPQPGMYGERHSTPLAPSIVGREMPEDTLSHYGAEELERAGLALLEETTRLLAERVGDTGDCWLIRSRGSNNGCLRWVPIAMISRTRNGYFGIRV